MLPTKVYDGATADGASTAVVADGSVVYLSIEGTGGSIDPVQINTFNGLQLRLNRASGVITVQYKWDDTYDTWTDFQDANMSWSYTAAAAVYAWLRES